MGPEEEVIDKAVNYSIIFFGLSPSMFLFFLMMSIYRSFGDYQLLAVINVSKPSVFTSRVSTFRLMLSVFFLIPSNNLSVVVL